MNLLKSSMCWKRVEVVGSVVVVLLFILAGSTGPAVAQSTPVAKPGLWEMQVSMTHKTALPPEAEARIAAMPQAQQDQVRAMMSGGGMGGGSQPTTITKQVCITPQSSMDSMLNQSQQSPGMKCSFTNRVQTEHGASFDISCTGPTGSATGHSQFRMVDDDHVSSTTHMTVTGSSNGHTMNSTVDSTSTGKFVSTDCGDVKPFTPPAGSK